MWYFFYREINVIDLERSKQQHGCILTVLSSTFKFCVTINVEHLI